MNKEKEMNSLSFKELTIWINTLAVDKESAWDCFLHIQDKYNDRELSYKQYNVIINYLLQIMKD